MQKLQALFKLGENCSKYYKTFRTFHLQQMCGDGDASLLPERLGNGCTLPSHHLISESPALKPCIISSDAKGLCTKLQLGVGALQQPLWSQTPLGFLLPSTAQSLFSFGSLIDLHLPGRTVERGDIPEGVSGEWGPTTGQGPGP